MYLLFAVRRGSARERKETLLKKNREKISLSSQQFCLSVQHLSSQRDSIDLSFHDHHTQTQVYLYKPHCHPYCYLQNHKLPIDIPKHYINKIHFCHPKVETNTKFCNKFLTDMIPLKRFTLIPFIITTPEPQKLTLTNKHTSSINISSLRRRMTEQPKNKKKEAVCVTGVNDFIGSWLVGTLLDFGYTTIQAHGSNHLGLENFAIVVGKIL